MTTKPNLFRKQFSLIEIMLVVLLLTVGWGWFSLSEVTAAKRDFALPVASLTESRPKGSHTYRGNYTFMSDWFSVNIPVWERALESFRDKPNLQYLEVGAFEGRSFLWMIENILTHPTSKGTAIDLFDGAYEANFPEFAKHFFQNVAVSGASERIISRQGYSQHILRELPLESYDIIYIDGSHENSDTLEDAILCHRLLKSGGILIFDDYIRRDPQYGAPKLAIDSFYRYFGKSYELLHSDEQVLLRKR